MSQGISVLLLSAALLAAPAASPAQKASGPPLHDWTAPPFWSPAWNVRAGRQESDRRVKPKRVEAPAAVPPTYGLVSIAPCRQYDSRSSTPLAQATPRTVTLTGSPCNIPPGAAAVSVNIAVFNIAGATGNGVFDVGIPSGSSIAWLNYPPTQVQTDNAGIVPVDGSGNVQVEVFQGGGSVDFVVDVNGYYAILPFGVRTVVVSPVGTPAENGAALLAALAGITTNAAGNPWLLKLEPGLYDVGTTPLVMKDYVDLEGSGEATTTIQAPSQTSASDGTVDLASNSQIRFVTIANTGGGAQAVAIGGGTFTTSSTILHTTATALGGTTFNIAMSLNCSCSVSSSTATAQGSGGSSSDRAEGINVLGSLRLRDVLVTSIGGGLETLGINSNFFGNLTGQFVTVTASAGGSGSATTGIVAATVPALSDSTVSVSGGTTNTGIEVDGVAGPADLSNLTITVQGPASSQNLGLVLVTAVTAVRNSHISVTGGSQATGLSQAGSTLVFQNSSVTAQQATTASYGIHILTVTGAGGVANINNSTVVGDTAYLVMDPSSHAFIGASQLKVGPVLGSGTAVCAGVFDGSYTFFPSTCP